MPRRFFRKFAIKRPHSGEQWYFAPFKRWLKDGRLWSIRRRTVVPALALGLFVAFLPFPGHTLIAIFFAIVLGLNVPVAAIATWVVNPLTIGPIYYANYRLGTWLLELEERPFEFELSWQWLGEKLGAIWQPFLLGSAVMGAGIALLSYITINLLWRYSIADYKARKIRERHRRHD